MFGFLNGLPAIAVRAGHSARHRHRPGWNTSCLGVDLFFTISGFLIVRCRYVNGDARRHSRCAISSSAGSPQSG